jgi:hypothetical protein
MRSSFQENQFYEFIQKELKSIMPVMMKNTKSYVLWFHRIWLLKMAAEHEEKTKILLEKSVLTGEIGLCSQFLLKDERNFHCWNYRMKIFLLIEQFFSQEFPKFLQSELDITINLIKKNFSNFSAWHYRTKIIPFYFKLNNIKFQSQEAIKYFEQDLEYITSAIFTAPHEQSCWNYHYWLVNNMTPIYVESLSINNNSVKMQFSDIFRIKENTLIKIFHNKTEIQGCSVTTEKTYSNILELNMHEFAWDRIEVISLDRVGNEASEVNSNICFTKYSVQFANIIISKTDNDNLVVSFQNKSDELAKLLQSFLISQLKIVNDLIDIEEKDQSFFYEYARFRKAQLETFILFSFYNPIIKENAQEANLLVISIKDQYEKLMKNSKRMKNMYETLFKNFNQIINE